jgi:ferredoxin-NADP reductase
MKVKLVKKSQEAPHVFSYFFDPGKAIPYSPGKFVYFVIEVANKDDRGNMRHFSIASSPTEGKIIQLTIKDGISLYKSALQNLTIGSWVELDGPHGIYEWPTEGNKDQLFIAGGVGIAAFRGRIKYNIDTKLPTKIALLYSTTSLETCIYKKELENWARENRFFTLIFHESSRMGRINKVTLKRTIKLLNNPTLWVCGSPRMVDNIENALTELGEDQKNILTEKFTGY